MSNLIKIFPVGASRSMRTNGQTDKHDEANSRFFAVVGETAYKKKIAR